MIHLLISPNVPINSFTSPECFFCYYLTLRKITYLAIWYLTCFLLCILIWQVCLREVLAYFSLTFGSKPKDLYTLFHSNYKVHGTMHLWMNSILHPWFISRGFRLFSYSYILLVILFFFNFSLLYFSKYPLYSVYFHLHLFNSVHK